jgi:ABC-type transport system involved in multi-copper enzyme maturation permease subunit
MYLWKYWRESRITFAVGMALVGLLLWGVLKIHLGALLQGPQDSRPQNLAQLYLVIAVPLTLPLGFLGLRFGSFGVGRDLGEGSGSFLFSRPRSRAFFVWNDWGFGMAQLLAIVLAANVVLALAIYRVAPGASPIFLARQPVSMFSIFLLHCTAGLLLTGLIFGLTYFASVLSRGHGVMIAVGVLVAYSIAKSVVKHYWPAIILPDVTLTEFSVSPSPTMPAGFADHLGLSIVLRTAVALAFPFAAQLLLQQRDVD